MEMEEDVYVNRGETQDEKKDPILSTPETVLKCFFPPEITIVYLKIEVEIKKPKFLSFFQL